jgi:capsule polysaccharide export protein KpsC/LpsZ
MEESRAEKFKSYIAEHCVAYMKENSDDFIKKFDLLTGALQLGTKHAVDCISLLKECRKENLDYDEFVKKARKLRAGDFQGYMDKREDQTDIIFIKDVIRAFDFADSMTTKFFTNACDCRTCEDDCEDRRFPYEERATTDTENPNCSGENHDNRG